jgi:hypothetical protein
MKIALPNGQIATVASAVTSSVTVPVSSITLASALTSGQAVSFGIPFTIAVNSSVGGQTTITFTRTDTGDVCTVTDSSSPWAGGYIHIGKTGDASGTLAVSFAGVSA